MMNARTKSFRALALTMAVVFGAMTLQAGQLSAEMISTDRVITQSQADEARATVDSFMAREDVKSQMEAFGVDPSEAEARIDTLSDQEAVDLAQRIDQAPAGQGVIGPIIGAAVLIFLVLLITDLLGFTSVFGFTNKGSANPG